MRPVALGETALPFDHRTALLEAVVLFDEATCAVAQHRLLVGEREIHGVQPVRQKRAIRLRWISLLPP